MAENKKKKAKNDSGFADTIMDGVSEIIDIDIVGSAFSAATEVAAGAGRIAIDGAAAVVDVGLEVGGKIVEGIADGL